MTYLQLKAKSEIPVVITYREDCLHFRDYKYPSPQSSVRLYCRKQRHLAFFLAPERGGASTYYAAKFVKPPEVIKLVGRYELQAARFQPNDLEWLRSDIVFTKLFNNEQKLGKPNNEGPYFS